MPASRRNAPAPPVAPADVAVVAAVVVAAVLFRFLTTSPLWLDEALSVNIATLPIDDLPDALRRDGHPPLYYALLHLWMEVFGGGDFAVRSLSGIASVLTLPLAYVAGRRRGGRPGGLAVLLVTAVTPWTVRYGTEARMYAFVFLLALAGWLLAEDLLQRPSRVRWAGLVVVTGALVLSHYWALYLGAAAVLLLMWRGWQRPGARAGVRRVLTSLAVGALFFVPWLPVFFDQMADTGTPWATATRPTRAVVELAGGVGGGERYAEAVLFGMIVLVLALVGLTASAVGARHLELDFRTVPGVRWEVTIVATTAALGLVAGFVADAVFVARYAAVFLPMLLVATGIGLARIPPLWPRRIAALVLLALAGVGWFVNVRDSRSQGEEIADAIAQEATPGDVVAFCPDQLGPSTLRYLPTTVRAVGLPALSRPERIDWRDYAERNEAADPGEAVSSLVEAAPQGSVWLVVHPGYRTYEGYCEAVVGGLVGTRPPGITVVRDRAGEVFEPATLYRFPAPGEQLQE